MSQSKKSKRPQSTKSAKDAAAQVQAIARALSLPEAMPKADRKRTQDRTLHVTDALIEMLASISDENEGHVAGMPFDGTEARSALALARESRSLATAARMLARRAGDDALAKRALVADRAFAVYAALERLVRTPEGKALQTAYEEMRVASRRRARRSKKNAATATTTEPPAPPPQPAPVTSAAVAEAPKA